MPSGQNFNNVVVFSKNFLNIFKSENFMHKKDGSSPPQDLLSFII